MKRLLAVAVQGGWVGDWHHVRGDEHSIVVYPVSASDRVLLEVECPDGNVIFPLQAGTNRISVGAWLRYRVIKECDDVEKTSHTNVELLTYAAQR